MAKMRNTSPAGNLISTRVPVTNILSVGRQPHNKRQPHEVENIDNAFVSLEKNIEKRSGFDIVLQQNHPSLIDDGWVWNNLNTAIDLWSLRDAFVGKHDLWYYWYHINEDSRFLVVVDYSAAGKDERLFYNYHLLKDGTWEDVTGDRQWDPLDPSIQHATPGNENNSTVVQAYATAHPTISYAEALALGTLSKSTREYITYNPNSRTAKESLKAVTLGSSIVILNNNVSAGFSSDYTTDEATNGMLFDLGGNVTDIPDAKGRRLQYFTSAKVIEVFNEGEDGTSDTGDDVSIGYKIDPVTTGTVRTAASSGTSSVALQLTPAVHSSVTTAGSTVLQTYLSGTASSVANSYIGLTLDVTPPTASAATMSAEIIAYDHINKVVTCWDKDTIESGVLSQDSANMLTVYFTAAAQAHVGHFLVINGEYRRIASAADLTSVTVQSAFSGTPAEHLGAGDPYSIVPYLVSITGDVQANLSNVHLGTHASTVADAHKGQYITIAGITKRIVLYNSTTKVATLDSTLAAAPAKNSSYTLTQGIGWGGYVAAIGGGAVTTITLPSTASTVTNAYKGYVIAAGTATNRPVITAYDGTTKVATFTSTTFSPAVAAGALITITPPTASVYTIHPKYPADDYYAGYEIVLTTGSTVQTNTISSYVSSTNTATLVNPLTSGITTSTTYRISSGNAAYIPAGDYNYYKTELMHLGQLVSDISSIRLPPEDYDWYANNANLNDSGSPDINARTMLAALYDEHHPFKEVVDGRGKIYLTTNSYLNLTAGYYRVINFVESRDHTILTGTGSGTSVTGTGRPYLQKVRTPDEWSYIDPARMPQKLSFEVEGGKYVWTAEPMAWTPRDTGDNRTNPGPSIFRNLRGTELKHSKITAMAVFKNRLWFAADDVVFSSRIGDYENLFIADPTNLVDTDPIDIRASSNTFAQITTMTPFEDYMFVNTKADTQFQLMSSNANNGQDLAITPFNVILSPSTYYAAAAIVDPQLLGNQLYFFDKRRMYLFTGKNQFGFTSAVEVSSTVKDYLPENYGSACVSAAHNTAFVTDADNPNHIYCYTIRFSGDRVIQSSFYRHILGEASDIKAIQAYENVLYAVVADGDPADNDSHRLYLQKMDMQNADMGIPRLDNKYLTKLLVNNPDEPTVAANCYYDQTLNETTIQVPLTSIFASHISGGFSTGLYLVFADDWFVDTSYPITASASSSILTVTNTGDLNIIAVGSVITGGGIPAEGATVTEIITGVGGVGTYRLSGFAGTQASASLVSTVTDDISGTIFTDFKSIIAADHIKFVLLGRYDVTGKHIYIGTTYTTTVELGEVFVRDQNGGVYNGTLNLRNCRVHHHDTGNYDVVVSHRGRTPTVSSFAASRPDLTFGEGLLSLRKIEDHGKFLSSVFGYSDSTTVKLVSNYVTPMNIVDLEFMGKFKNRHTII